MASGWLLIDTAPRDGTQIDVWEDGGRVTDVFFSSGRWVYQKFWRPHDKRHPEKGGIWRRVIVDNPTHWMPHPLSPSAEENIDECDVLRRQYAAAMEKIALQETALDDLCVSLNEERVELSRLRDILRKSGVWR